MKKVILKIEGMTCSSCSNTLEKYLNKQKGVKASVNLVLAQALINYPDNLTIKDLENFVKEAGFSSGGVFKNFDEEKNKKRTIYKLIIATFLMLLVMYLTMGHMLHLPIIPYFDKMMHPLNYAFILIILTIIFLIYGFDILKRGLKNLIHLTPNMDSLVTLGVSASFIYSLFNVLLVILGNNEAIENLYFESCIMIIYFIKLGKYIENKNKAKTTEAIKKLVQITPNKTIKIVNNTEKVVTIDEVKKGDILIAKPGMKIAVDGLITKGNTHLDESFITGESIFPSKKIGDKVIAGSLNIDGVIYYEAIKIGANSTISEIVRLVVEATNTKAPIARLADKVSSFFVPILLFIAIFTFSVFLLLGLPFNEAINTFVTILVVACPCALGLATPLAITISEGNAAKEGILIKSSETLENASKIDTIVFDKTGTLTYGNLKISKIYNYTKKAEKDILLKVASLEKLATHPISSLFKDYLKTNNITPLEVSNFTNLDGIGLKGSINKKEIYIGNNKLFKMLKLENKKKIDEQELISKGNSLIYVIENNKVLALIGVQDIVRKEAKKVIKALSKEKKEIIMLTGDNEKTAKIIAKDVGIKNIKANLMPQEKVAIIKNLSNEGKKVMMVGDGINDAPSLAKSLIGVSFNNSSDIATNSADVILTNNNLEKILELMNISQKTLKNIKGNLFWAFFYNALMIPLAIGLFRPFNLTINPMIASFAMTLSSLTVVLNALRLRNITRH